jgi:pimeloyl-ACP methyl ester carboxylesterase
MSSARALLLTAAILLASTMLTACAPSARLTADHLHHCSSSEGPPGGYCGTLAVPENPTAPAGRQIELKIVVAPALRREPAPDPLFVVLGGPGEGAASIAATLLPLFGRFQTDRDVVFVDQRGTGASRPLDCMPQDRERTLTEVVDQPLEPWQACLGRLKADVRFYTTTYAVDDLEEVRRHLGYGHIDVWAASYGTRLAQLYLARHPDVVRAMILDSAAPPDVPAPLFWARDGQRALDLLIADCARDLACHAHFPDLAATVRGALERAATQPVIRMADPRTGAALQGRISRDLIAGAIFGMLYSSTSGAQLPRLLADAADGDFQGLTAIALAHGSTSGAFLSVYCSEDAPRFTREDALRESAGTFLGTAAFDTVFRPCAIWPKGAASPHLTAMRSRVPVLVLSGALDPVAPPPWGASIVAMLPNARQIVVPATGHLVSPRGCVPLLIGSFLRTADVQVPDAGCLESLHRPPFITSRAAGTL